MSLIDRLGSDHNHNHCSVVTGSPYRLLIAQISERSPIIVYLFALVFISDRSPLKNWLIGSFITWISDTIECIVQEGPADLCDIVCLTYINMLHKSPV